MLNGNNYLLIYVWYSAINFFITVIFGFRP